ASPVAPEGAGDDPEDRVAGARAWTAPGRAGQDRELVAQQQVLGNQVAAIADGGAEPAEQQTQVVTHRRHDPTASRRCAAPCLSPDRGRWSCSRPYDGAYAARRG